MSGVKNGYILNNVVYKYGSNNARNWGRGSGFWAWESLDVLIENNRITIANSPVGSAGA